jgi:uncharacterized protein (TIGR03083 family)
MARKGSEGDHWADIAEQRVALAATLESLTPDQWATPSLCGVWTVRHVAAHLAAPLRQSLVPTIASFTVGMLKAGGSFERANVAYVDSEARRPTTEVVADLRTHADSRFHPPGFGSEAPLTEILVHGQDILVPLGLVGDPPAALWRPVLDFVVTRKARRGFVPKPPPVLRYVATDVDWAFGSGDEIHGPARALALALMGRPALSDQLDGPGVGALGA